MMRKLLSKQNLNGATLFVAFGLFCYSFAASTPQALVFTAETMLAQAVGASASVPPNAVNTYIKELADKEKELNEREKRIAYLEEREDVREGGSEGDPWALASLGTSVMLFGLVGVNFYLDRRRGRLAVSNPFSINLKQRG